MGWEREREGREREKGDGEEEEEGEEVPEDLIVMFEANILQTNRTR